MTPDALGRRRADRRASIRRSSRFADGIDEDEAARRVRDRAPGRDLGVHASRRHRRTSPTCTACSSCRGCSGCSSASSPSRPSATRSPPACAVAGTTSGVVRSLGFVARDVLRALTTQSWTLVAVGLAVGIPLGIALGRVAWQVVAERIGVRAARRHVAARAAGGRRCSRASRPRPCRCLPGVAAARQRAVDALRVE